MSYFDYAFMLVSFALAFVVGRASVQTWNDTRKAQRKMEDRHRAEREALQLWRAECEKRLQEDA